MTFVFYAKACTLETKGGDLEITADVNEETLLTQVKKFLDSPFTHVEIGNFLDLIPQDTLCDYMDENEL